MRAYDVCAWVCPHRGGLHAAVVAFIGDEMISGKTSSGIASGGGRPFTAYSLRGQRLGGCNKGFGPFAGRRGVHQGGACARA